MFGTGPAPEYPSSGKKIHGYQSRKQDSFSLGWDSSNQLNEVQQRKSQRQEATGKITQCQPSPLKSRLAPTAPNPQNPQIQHRKQENLNVPQKQALEEEYQKLLREYPDIPAEEIHKIVFGNVESTQSEGKRMPDHAVNSFGQIPPSYASDSKSKIDTRTPVRPQDSIGHAKQILKFRDELYQTDVYIQYLQGYKSELNSFKRLLWYST